jgi:hypothetical protein
MQDLDCQDDRLLWEQVLRGIAIIYWTALVVPLGALVFGLVFMAVANVRRMDAPVMLGMLGFTLVYMLGMGGVVLGLHFCSQVPASFRGKGYVQAALVFVLAAGLAGFFTCGWLPIRLPWSRDFALSLGGLYPFFLEAILIASAGLAILNGLLFAGAVADHFGASDLSRRARQRFRLLIVWLTGAMVLPILADFLAVEAPWLGAVDAGWKYLFGGLLLLSLAPVVAGLRRTIRTAVGESHA